MRERTRLPDPKKGKLLHRHASRMSRDFPVILKNSQNLHAEVLLKSLGKVGSSVGSIDAGAQQIKKYLRKIKVADPQLRIADGSGLS